MLRVRHLATALATTIVATMVAVVLPAPTAQAAVGEYVALGDSYASGVGTREYLEESADCRRSPHAYPVDQAARLGAPLSFQACSGAVVAGVRSAQLGMLDGGTGYVSVQVGGNDAGFSSVITECAKPAWAQDCVGAVEDARAIINGELPGRLAGLYSDISARAPTATVLVVGYRGCSTTRTATRGPSSARRIDNCSTTLPMSSTTGWMSRPSPPVHVRGPHHGVSRACGLRRTGNGSMGLSNPVRESYHPNRAGQDGYGDLVASALG